MDVPKTLADFPWVLVNIDCRCCSRNGRYKLARLAAKFGSEIALEKLLEQIALDCQWMRPEVKMRKYEARCGIRFTDLDKGQPPPDLPPAPGKPLRVIEGGKAAARATGGPKAAKRARRAARSQQKPL